jgi:hypothetical protein
MGPFEQHLREAIEVNKSRAALYSKLTNGQSIWVSRMLIISEVLSLPFSKFPDLWGNYFIKRGIPILKEEFMPMDGIGMFSNQYPFNPEPLSEFIPQNGKLISRRIRAAYQTGEFSGASAQIEIELKMIESPCAYHAMLRHILESLLRISNLAPLHEKRRLELGIKRSTLPLSQYLFYSHFSAFAFACWLDKKAAPIQSRGVPIIYQDVPSIPAKTSSYG